MCKSNQIDIARKEMQKILLVNSENKDSKILLNTLNFYIQILTRVFNALQTLLRNAASRAISASCALLMTTAISASRHEILQIWKLRGRQRASNQ